MRAQRRKESSQAPKGANHFLGSRPTREARENGSHWTIPNWRPKGVKQHPTYQLFKATMPRRRRWNGPKTWVPSPWRLGVLETPIGFPMGRDGNQPYSRGLYTNYKDSLYYFDFILEYIDWTLYSWTKILTSQLYVIIIPARCPVITTLLGTKISRTWKARTWVDVFPSFLPVGSEMDSFQSLRFMARSNEAWVVNFTSQEANHLVIQDRSIVKLSPPPRCNTLPDRLNKDTPWMVRH